MKQRLYKYGFLFRVYRFIVLTATIWGPVYILGNSYIKNSLQFNFLNNPYFWIAFILEVIVIEYGALTIGQSFSNVKTDKTGLYIEYFWKYVQIPWSKVSLKSSIVYSETLPLVFYGQGLLFRLSLKKIFLIFPYISNYKDLLEEINEYCKNNTL